MREGYVPWWQWALISTGGLCLSLIAITAAVVALALQGVDIRDYLELARPPFIRSGGVAAWLGVVLLAQTAGPLLAFALVPPCRRALRERLCRPAGAVRGLLMRVALGGLLFLALQLLWAAVGPEGPPTWRVVEHLAYAVGRGARFWPAFWLLAAVGLAGPVAEELLFRGVLFGYLRRRWGFPAGALLSAAVFGSLHGPAHALPTGLMGLYLAWQVERDGSLYGAMALHALHNLAATGWLIWTWLPR